MNPLLMCVEYSLVPPSSMAFVKESLFYRTKLCVTREILLLAVPLSKHFPQPLMEYYINDCNATLLVTTSQYVDTMYELSKKTNRQLLVLDDDCRSVITFNNHLL